MEDDDVTSSLADDLIVTSSRETIVTSMIQEALPPGFHSCKVSTAFLSFLIYSIEQRFPGYCPTTSPDRSRVITTEHQTRDFFEEKVIGNVLYDTNISDRSERLRNRLKVIWWCKE